MSKDIIVLTPNGRRQKVHCTPDTNMLQVLEDVCQKHGLQSSDYELKHHNKILDLTTTIRFSNLPNKATLELVEAERKREESNVTIGLQLEDGERKTAEFPPSTTLYDIVTSLAPHELHSLQKPTIMYMRQEVIDVPELKSKTLRQLGLIKGRAILRLMNKSDEPEQANVSAVYRVPLAEGNQSAILDDKIKINTDEDPAHKEQPKREVTNTTEKKEERNPQHAKVTQQKEPQSMINHTPMEVDNTQNSELKSTREDLERRLKIEEEVTFVGNQKAVVFMQPEVANEWDDLPDDFYELSVEEVRKLYYDLQKNRIELENTPLVTESLRKIEEDKNKQQKLNIYKNAVVRIQFPDNIILQGIFEPTNTIQDISNFVKEHLQTPEKSFQLFTIPLKDTLDPKKSLLDAKFVPCVHLHFKWLTAHQTDNKCLKHDIYKKLTSSDAASILASKYRAPTRRKMSEETAKSQNSHAGPSSSKNSKVPKWFKK